MMTGRPRHSRQRGTGTDLETAGMERKDPNIVGSLRGGGGGLKGDFGTSRK